MNIESSLVPLNNELDGVILIGGQSKRMGKPKALLSFNGKLLYQHLAQILQNSFDQVYLSHNVKQFVLTDSKYAIIEDRLPSSGPISGIISCLEQLNKPLFVLPCDMPFITTEIVLDILSRRNTENMCTVYFNETNGFYEPLLGVWEQKSLEILKDSFSDGVFSLQKILQKNKVSKNIPLDISIFKNLNTPDDYESIL
ncbi:MAG: molybdenum cofactor guanylyltransferase [Saprospiraceae bacterium]